MTARAPPVQARGGGFGLDAELAQRAAERYDYTMEEEAREWIEEISEMEIGDDFGQGLRDGIILCTLANKIHPGVVKRVETKSKMPFKLMENVSAFLRACRVMGVSEFDLFETVDLFELKDLGHVVRCIFALGRAVQKNYPDFHGPTLGVKEAVKNERQFSNEKLLAARAAPSLVNLGSVRTMPRLDVSRTNNVTFGAEAALNPHRAPPPPPPPSKEKIESLSRFRAEPDEERSPARTANGSVVSLTNSMNKVSVSDSAPATPPKDLTAEEEAQAWIEEVLNEKFLASFGDSLKDGVILCTLMNKIRPGLIPRIQTSQMPFKQMENVSSFLKACRTLGVAEFDLFETVDLYELKNIDLVVKCIHALGRTLQKNVPDYTGPTLGVKEATVNKRTFSNAQLLEAAAAVPILSHASSTIMERKAFDRSASVTFGADAGVSGLAQTTPTVPPVQEEKSLTKEDSADHNSAGNGEVDHSSLGSVNRLASVNWSSDGHAVASKHSIQKPSSTSTVLPTRTIWS